MDGQGPPAMAGEEVQDQQFEDFLDICERIMVLSNDLNKYNLSSFQNRVFQLEPHEQAIYTLHTRHVLDFCKTLDPIISRSGPIVPLPLVDEPVAPVEQPIQPPVRSFLTPGAGPTPPSESASTPIPPGRSPQSAAAAALLLSGGGPMSSAASSATETAVAGSSQSSELLMDRVYYAGQDFSATTEMDINIKKGDRIKVVMIMDDEAMALGSNVETGAMGTFPVACATTGTLAPKDAENAPSRSVDTATNISGDGGSTLPRGASLGAGEAPTEQKGEWSPLPVPNPLNRKIGRHVASRSYQSGSVLEASLERGDEVEIMFWEDDEIAVGIHIPTQSEGLFRGSMLIFSGEEGDGTGAGISSASMGQGVRTLPLNDGRMIEIPTDMPFAERKESLAPKAAGVVDNSERKSILAAVVAFQQNDANQYKDYLDQIDNDGSSTSAYPPHQYDPYQQRNPNMPNPYHRPMHNAGGFPGPGQMMPQAGGLENVLPPPRVSSAVFGMTITGDRGVPSTSNPTVMTPEEERRLQGAKHVLSELHATEESYMKLLRIFMDHVVEPMREARILTSVDIDRMFKHLQPIHELSVKVESHLREAADSGTGDPTPVVNLFLKNIQHEEWIVYENYIKNYQPAKQIIQKMAARADAKGEQFRQFCRKIENDENCARKNLDDFMMLPIQRITRYWLLLERLKKYMEVGSVGYESIEVAENYMKEVGNTLQGVQIREEEMRKMFEIVNTVDNCPSSILSYSKRRFIAEYDCMDLNGASFGYGLVPSAGGVLPGMSEAVEGWQVVSNMVTSGPGQRRLFVFSDCILVAAYRTGRRAANVAKKLELVQKLDSRRILIENRTEIEMETDIMLRLRIVSHQNGKPDDVFHFRMNDVRSRKAVEKTIFAARMGAR
ncbi:hypothetical protein HDU97_010069 [Phlyctochytrium planicorne]|nr:hypothetical protein HDU97_010069 [Phlyctochytrium planicorne]